MPPLQGRRSVNIVEIIVVLVILGVVAMLALPRFSRAADTPHPGQVLRHRLKILRVAVERYRQDHGHLPGQRPDGVNPIGSPATVLAQLTGHSDLNGQVARQPTSLHRYGPYLRDGVPPCPVPPHAGDTRIHVTSGPAVGFVDPSVDAGWVYNVESGHVAVNSDATDAQGHSYASY